MQMQNLKLFSVEQIMELVKNKIKYETEHLSFGVIFVCCFGIEPLVYRSLFPILKKNYLAGIKVKNWEFVASKVYMFPCWEWCASTGVFPPFRRHNRFQPHLHIYQWVESLVVGCGNVMPIWESLGLTCIIGFARPGRSGHSWQCVEWREDCVCVLSSPLGWGHRNPDSSAEVVKTVPLQKSSLTVPVCIDILGEICVSACVTVDVRYYKCLST